MSCFDGCIWYYEYEWLAAMREFRDTIIHEAFAVTGWQAEEELYD